MPPIETPDDLRSFSTIAPIVQPVKNRINKPKIYANMVFDLNYAFHDQDERPRALISWP